MDVDSANATNGVERRQENKRGVVAKFVLGVASDDRWKGKYGSKGREDVVGEDVDGA